MPSRVRTLTVGSLFSGIGGLELGLERAGMQVRWQVEIDDYCRRVLTKHWPDVPKYSDIRELSADELEPVDLICGGFPCQPHSVAGKRQASEDERDLWGEFYRLICELRPIWVLAENVPGLLSSESGRFFGRVLRDLAASGYDTEWDCIPAAAVGAPHIRDRVFIVAHSRCLDLQRWGECRDLASAPRTSEGNREEREWRRDATHHSRAIGAGVNAMADATSARRDDRPSRESRPVRHEARRAGLERFSSSIGTAQWSTEPDVGRMVDGIPHRVDRLRGLGNAVVPQVAQFIGERIVAYVEGAA